MEIHIQILSTFLWEKKEKTIEKRRKRRSKNLNNIIYNEWLYVCVYSAHNTHKHKHTVGKEKKNLTKTELNIIIVVVHIKHECIGLVNTYSSRFFIYFCCWSACWIHSGSWRRSLIILGR